MLLAQSLSKVAVWDCGHPRLAGLKHLLPEGSCTGLLTGGSVQPCAELIHTCFHELIVKIQEFS